jgi:hypothetical protein
MTTLIISIRIPPECVRRQMFPAVISRFTRSNLICITDRPGSARRALLLPLDVCIVRDVE